MNNNTNLRRRFQNLRRLYREDREAFNNSIKRMSSLNAGYITYDPTLYFGIDRRFTLNDAKILRKIIDRVNGPLVPLYFEGFEKLGPLMRNANDTTKDYIIRRILRIKNEGLIRKLKSSTNNLNFTITSKNLKNKTGNNFKTFLQASNAEARMYNFMEYHYLNGLNRQKVNTVVKGYKVRRPKILKKKGNALGRIVGKNSSLPRNIVRKIGEKTQLRTLRGV
jgi:hypothetical protein